jgi:DNA-binding response OmpR family regulator
MLATGCSVSRLTGSGGMKEIAALIVEDDDAVQQLLHVILRRHCKIVDCAGDGQRAIEMLHDRNYDVVLLDLMLPKMNGFEVAESIRKLANPPKVIVLSAVSRFFRDRFPPDAVVLQKPFDVEQLDDVLRTLP